MPDLSPTLPLFVVPLILIGCAHETSNLKPATSSGTDADGADDVENIRLTVNTDAWPGDPDVGDHVTPLQLVMENHSEHAVRIRYEDFRLVGDDEQYVAIPPYDVEGQLSKYPMPHTHGPTPLFEYDDYYVSEPYAHLYPGIPAYPKPPSADPSHEVHYYVYSTSLPLPTPEMLDWALPEGVVESGGRVRGFLYFDRVERGKRYVFQAALTTVDDLALGVAETPLVSEP